MHDLSRCPRRKLYHAGPYSSPSVKPRLVRPGAASARVKILRGLPGPAPASGAVPFRFPSGQGPGNEYMVRKPSESEDEDRSLLQRVARGDRDAFAMLYDR